MTKRWLVALGLVVALAGCTASPPQSITPSADPALIAKDLGVPDDRRAELAALLDEVQILTKQGYSAGVAFDSVQGQFVVNSDAPLAVVERLRQLYPDVRFVEGAVEGQ